MKSPIRIGLPPKLKAVYIERYTAIRTSVESPRSFATGYWLLPISVNNDRTLGTFIMLKDDGSVEHWTYREDGDHSMYVIKPKDE